MAEAKLCLFMDSFTNESVEDGPPLKTLLKEGYKTDPFPQKIQQMLKDGICQSKDITLAECRDNNTQLRYLEPPVSQTTPA